MPTTSTTNPDVTQSGSCTHCVPAREASAATPHTVTNPEASGQAPRLVKLEGGAFHMGNHLGDGYPADGEGPVHEVILSPFEIAPETVTNAQFGAFIADTGYRTEADTFGWSFVFAGFLPPDQAATRGVSAAPWWRQIFGATWQHPEGPGSEVTARQHHPAIHISWNDAMAFCSWSGTRLPTEAEWEFSARGGHAQTHFSWGDQLTPNGKHRMNVWQGAFPARNSSADGYRGTAPVNAYQPNAYGLSNMTGNVWEWCADWFDPGYYASSPAANPAGPVSGTNRVMRGGSYLCHKSYCNRYRVDSRSSTTPDSSTGNIGFRVARSL